MQWLSFVSSQTAEPSSAENKDKGKTEEHEIFEVKEREKSGQEYSDLVEEAAKNYDDHSSASGNKRKLRLKSQRSLTQSLRLPLADPSLEDTYEEEKNLTEDDSPENELSAKLGEAVSPEVEQSTGPAAESEHDLKTAAQITDEVAGSGQAITAKQSQEDVGERAGVVSYEERRLESILVKSEPFEEKGYVRQDSQTVQASYHECTINADFTRKTLPLEATINSGNQTIKRGTSTKNKKKYAENNKKSVSFNEQVEYSEVAINSKHKAKGKDLFAATSLKDSEQSNTSFEEKTTISRLRKGPDSKEASLTKADPQGAAAQHSEISTSSEILSGDEEESTSVVLDQKINSEAVFRGKCEKRSLAKIEEQQASLEIIVDSTTREPVVANIQSQHKNDSSNVAEKFFRSSSESTIVDQLLVEEKLEKVVTHNDKAAYLINTKNESGKVKKSTIQLFTEVRQDVTDQMNSKEAAIPPSSITEELQTKKHTGFQENTPKESYASCKSTIMEKTVGDSDAKYGIDVVSRAVGNKDILDEKKKKVDVLTRADEADSCAAVGKRTFEETKKVTEIRTNTSEANLSGTTRKHALEETTKKDEANSRIAEVKSHVVAGKHIFGEVKMSETTTKDSEASSNIATSNHISEETNKIDDANAKTIEDVLCAAASSRTSVETKKMDETSAEVESPIDLNAVTSKRTDGKEKNLETAAKTGDEDSLAVASKNTAGEEKNLGTAAKISEADSNAVANKHTVREVEPETAVKTANANLHAFASKHSGKLTKKLETAAKAGDEDSLAVANKRTVVKTKQETNETTSEEASYVVCKHTPDEVTPKIAAKVGDADSHVGASKHTPDEVNPEIVAKVGDADSHAVASKNTADKEKNPETTSKAVVDLHVASGKHTPKEVKPESAAKAVDANSHAVASKHTPDEMNSQTAAKTNDADSHAVASKNTADKEKIPETTSKAVDVDLHVATGKHTPDEVTPKTAAKTGDADSHFVASKHTPDEVNPEIVAKTGDADLHAVASKSTTVVVTPETAAKTVNAESRDVASKYFADKEKNPETAAKAGDEDSHAVASKCTAGEKEQESTARTIGVKSHGVASEHTPDEGKLETVAKTSEADLNAVASKLTPEVEKMRETATKTGDEDSHAITIKHTPDEVNPETAAKTNDEVSHAVASKSIADEEKSPESAAKTSETDLHAVASKNTAYIVTPETAAKTGDADSHVASKHTPDEVNPEIVAKTGDADLHVASKSITVVVTPETAAKTVNAESRAVASKYFADKEKNPETAAKTGDAGSHVVASKHTVGETKQETTGRSSKVESHTFASKNTADKEKNLEAASKAIVADLHAAANKRTVSETMQKTTEKASEVESHVVSSKHTPDEVNPEIFAKTGDADLHAVANKYTACEKEQESTARTTGVKLHGVGSDIPDEVKPESVAKTTEADLNADAVASKLTPEVQKMREIATKTGSEDSHALASKHTPDEVKLEIAAKTNDAGSQAMASKNIAHEVTPKTAAKIPDADSYAVGNKLIVGKMKLETNERTNEVESHAVASRNTADKEKNSESISKAIDVDLLAAPGKHTPKEVKPESVAKAVDANSHAVASEHTFGGRKQENTERTSVVESLIVASMHPLDEVKPKVVAKIDDADLHTVASKHIVGKEKYPETTAKTSETDLHAVASKNTADIVTPETAAKTGDAGSHVVASKHVIGETKQETTERTSKVESHIASKNTADKEKNPETTAKTSETDLHAAASKNTADIVTPETAAKTGDAGSHVVANKHAVGEKKQEANERTSEVESHAFARKNTADKEKNPETTSKVVDVDLHVATGKHTPDEVTPKTAAKTGDAGSHVVASKHTVGETKQETTERTSKVESHTFATKNTADEEKNPETTAKTSETDLHAVASKNTADIVTPETAAKTVNAESHAVASKHAVGEKKQEANERISEVESYAFASKPVKLTKKPEIAAKADDEDPHAVASKYTAGEKELETTARTIGVNLHGVASEHNPDEVKPETVAKTGDADLHAVASKNTADEVMLGVAAKIGNADSHAAASKRSVGETEQKSTAMMSEVESHAVPSKHIAGEEKELETYKRAGDADLHAVVSPTADTADRLKLETGAKSGCADSHAVTSTHTSEKTDDVDLHAATSVVTSAETEKQDEIPAKDDSLTNLHAVASKHTAGEEKKPENTAKTDKVVSHTATNSISEETMKKKEATAKTSEAHSHAFVSKRSSVKTEEKGETFAKVDSPIDLHTVASRHTAGVVKKPHTTAKISAVDPHATASKTFGVEKKAKSTAKTNETDPHAPACKDAPDKTKRKNLIAVYDSSIANSHVNASKHTAVQETKPKTIAKAHELNLHAAASKLISNKFKTRKRTSLKTSQVDLPSITCSHNLEKTKKSVAKVDAAARSDVHATEEFFGVTKMETAIFAHGNEAEPWAIECKHTSEEAEKDSETNFWDSSMENSSPFHSLPCLRTPTLLTAKYDVCVSAGFADDSCEIVYSFSKEGPLYETVPDQSNVATTLLRDHEMDSKNLINSCCTEEDHKHDDRAVKDKDGRTVNDGLKKKTSHKKHADVIEQSAPSEEDTERRREDISKAIKFSSTAEKSHAPADIEMEKRAESDSRTRKISEKKERMPKAKEAKKETAPLKKAVLKPETTSTCVEREMQDVNEDDISTEMAASKFIATEAAGHKITVKKGEDASKLKMSKKGPEVESTGFSRKVKSKKALLIEEGKAKMPLGSPLVASSKVEYDVEMNVISNHRTHIEKASEIQEDSARSADKRSNQFKSTANTSSSHENAWNESECEGETLMELTTNLSARQNVPEQALGSFDITTHMEEEHADIKKRPSEDDLSSSTKVGVFQKEKERGEQAEVLVQEGVKKHSENKADEKEVTSMERFKSKSKFKDASEHTNLKEHGELLHVSSPVSTEEADVEKNKQQEIKEAGDIFDTVSQESRKTEMNSSDTTSAVVMNDEGSTDVTGKMEENLSEKKKKLLRTKKSRKENELGGMNSKVKPSPETGKAVAEASGNRPPNVPYQKTTIESMPPMNKEAESSKSFSVEKSSKPPKDSLNISQNVEVPSATSEERGKEHITAEVPDRKQKHHNEVLKSVKELDDLKKTAGENGKEPILRENIENDKMNLVLFKKQPSTKQIEQTTMGDSLLQSKTESSDDVPFIVGAATRYKSEVSAEPKLDTIALSSLGDSRRTHSSKTHESLHEGRKFEDFENASPSATKRSDVKASVVDRNKEEHEKDRNYETEENGNLSEVTVDYSSDYSPSTMAQKLEEKSSTEFYVNIPRTAKVEVTFTCQSKPLISQAVPKDEKILANKQDKNNLDDATETSKVSSTEASGLPLSLDEKTTASSQISKKESTAYKPKTKQKSYISKETEKLLQRKAKAMQLLAESEIEVKTKAQEKTQGFDEASPLSSTNLQKTIDTFGEQSTEPVTDLTTDSDFMVEQSKSDVGDAAAIAPSILHTSDAAKATDRVEQKQELGFAPSFLHKKQTMRCVEGRALVVNVFVRAVPQPKITVYHNNDLVVCANQLEPVRAQQPNLYSFSFTINSVHQEDSGKIMFKATNQWGFDECTTYLEIADESKRKFCKFDTNALFEREFEAAEVIWSVTDVTVAEGGSAWLYGKLCGYPVPELIWLKNGEEIDFEAAKEKFQAELKSDGTFALEIKNCTHEDENLYELTVENMAGVDSCLFKITVDNKGDEHERHRRRKHVLKNVVHRKNESSDSELENKTTKKRRRIRRVIERVNPNAPRLTQLIAPRFARPLDDCEAIEGEEVVMMVATQGDPPPTVNFYRNGKLLANDDKCKIFHKPTNEHYLILKNAEQHGEAEYACHAVNPAGEAWCYSDLHVRASATANVDESEPTSLEPAKKGFETQRDQAGSVKSKRGMKVKNIGKIFKKPFAKKEGPAAEEKGKVLQKQLEKKEEGPAAKDVNKNSEEDVTKRLSQKLPPRSTKKAAEEADLLEKAQTHAEVSMQKKKIPATDHDFPALAILSKDISGSSISLNESEMSINAAKRSAAAAAAKIGRKNKKRPKSLVIPLEINSLFGDRSVIRSETNLTTSITAIEAHAETASPLREPRSASISARLASPSRNRGSRTVSPLEISAEFRFERPPQSNEEEACIQIREGIVQKADDELNVESIKAKAVEEAKARIILDFDEDEELRQMLILSETDMASATKKSASPKDHADKEVNVTEPEAHKTGLQKKTKTKKASKTALSAESATEEKLTASQEAKEREFREEIASKLSEDRSLSGGVPDDVASPGKSSKTTLNTENKIAEPGVGESDQKAKLEESSHKAEPLSISEHKKEEKSKAKDKKQTEEKAKEDEGKKSAQEQRVMVSQPSSSTKEAAEVQQQQKVDKDVEAKSETEHLKNAGEKKDFQKMDNPSVSNTTDLDITMNLKEKKRLRENVNDEEAATSKEDDSSSTMKHHDSLDDTTSAAGTSAQPENEAQEEKGDKKTAKDSPKQKGNTSEKVDIRLEETKDQTQQAGGSTKQEREKGNLKKSRKEISAPKADEAQNDSELKSEESYVGDKFKAKEEQLEGKNAEEDQDAEEIRGFKVRQATPHDEKLEGTEHAGRKFVNTSEAIKFMDSDSDETVSVEEIEKEQIPIGKKHGVEEKVALSKQAEVTAEETSTEARATTVNETHRIKEDVPTLKKLSEFKEKSSKDKETFANNKITSDTRVAEEEATMSGEYITPMASTKDTLMETSLTLSKKDGKTILQKLAVSEGKSDDTALLEEKSDGKVTNKKQKVFEQKKRDEKEVTTKTETMEERASSDIMSKELKSTQELPTVMTVSKESGFVSVPEPVTNASIGKSLQLKCEVAHENDIVEWFIDGFSIADNPRYSAEAVGTTRTLLIRDVMPEDDDMVVEMRYGVSVATSRIALEKTVPRIVKQLKPELTYKKGSSVELEIELDHEATEVTWFKDGQPLQKMSKYSTEMDGAVCRLKIDVANISDSGAYVVAVNGVQSTTNLCITDIPHFKKAVPAEVSVKKDESIFFNVPFDCPTKPSVILLKDGAPLEDVEKFVEVSEKDICFHKNNAEAADAGEYTIMITNELGEDKKMVTVQINDVPQPPANLTLDRIDENKILLKWDCLKDDAVEYLVEKKDQNRRTYQKLAKVSGSKRSCEIQADESFAGCSFRVKAINKYGASIPCEITNTIGTFASALPQVTEPPTISELTSEGCSLTWLKPAINGGSDISGYDVFARKEGGKWEKVNDEKVLDEHYIVKNLQQGVNYEFKVDAYNDAGECSNSEMISQPIQLPVLDLPKTIPSIPQITVTGPDSVTVDWKTPEDELSPSFTVAYKSESSNVWTEVNCDTNFHKVDGLKEEVSYVFKVAVRNEHGTGNFSEMSSPIKIRPTSAPVIIKRIRDVSLPINDMLRLECHAKGHPTPEFVWYRNDVEIVPEDENVQIINEGVISVLIILKTHISDDGVYKCEAINTSGLAESTARVTIEDARCHFDTSFPKFNEATAGDDVELCCTVTESDGMVTWYKNGKKLKESDRINISVNGKKRVLRIAPATEADSGRYRCETSDGRSRIEGELFINGLESHIILGPQDQIVTRYGDTAVITCTLSNPSTHVKWYKNGKEIWQQANKYSIINEGRSSTLEILNFEKSDVGSYYAALDSNEVSAPAQLNLQIPPAIEIREGFEDKVRVQAHTDLEFRVVISGEPSPSVNILHNHSQINDRALLKASDNVIRICMKKLTLADSGFIEISAENAFGTSHKEFELSIIDVPSAPLELSSSNTTSSSTMLSWQAPKDTNCSPIMGYEIQRRTLDNPRWRTVGKTNATTLTFKASDLFSSEDYEFRVIALNIVGEGPASTHIGVTTLSENENQEEKTKIPHEISLLETPSTPIVSMNDGKAALTWDTVAEASFFKIERCKDGDDWLEIAMVTRPDYVDRSIMEDGIYSYRITAKGLNSSSEPSSSSIPLAFEGKKNEDTLSRKTDVEGKLSKESKNQNEDVSTRDKDKIEKKANDQEKEEPASKPIRHVSPVDAILDTKQRLKKRKPVEVERRASIQQDNLDSKQQKQPEPAQGETSNEKIDIVAGVDETKRSKTSESGKKIEEVDSIRKRGAPILRPISKVVTVKIGELAKLSVNVEGSTDVHCLWKKDGKTIMGGKKFRITYTDGIAELVVKDVDALCSGVYSLTASNPEGSDSTEVKLCVKRTPQTPAGPLEVAVEEGACKLSWKSPKDEGNSPVTAYVVEKYDEKLRKWNFLARTDSTSYVTDRQKFGSVQRFRVAAENDVGASPFVESEKVKIKPGTLSLDLDKPILTLCGVSTVAKWNPLPIDGVKYLVEIKEAKSRRPWTAVNEPVYGDSYEITGLTSGADYTVRVTAITPQAQGSPSEESDVFKYEELRENEKPSFLIIPEETIIQKGAKLKITTEYRGFPMPEVQWFKNKKEIFSGQRLWIETAPGVSTFAIADTREDDEGDYSILLRNIAGTSEHRFKLQVDTLPEINRPDRYASVLVYDEGETVKLRLTFSGRPAPSVEWFDNAGKSIKESTKYKIENSTYNTVLTINDISAQDRGEYKLRIKNRCGEDNFCIAIQTTERPGPPGKPSVQDQNVDSVRLLWSAPTQDGGSPVRFYTVEMCTASEGTWVMKEVTKQPFITLFNLTPGETYVFRVRADNAFGQSDPSEQSQAVFVKDVSREVEEPVKRPFEKEEPEEIDYDRLDAKVAHGEPVVIDINHLPNDLQAKYIICEELGQGAYGTVYRAVEKATGKTWAAKMIQVRPGVNRDDVVHEILMMNQLNHDKLLHLHEAFDLGNEMCLIEEFVSGGELFDKILENDSLMSEEEVRDYMHQILLGVQHMHRNQIVHLDLKPENILLKSKNSNDVKIIDFGLARKLDPKKSVKLLFGTPEFCAPEVVNYQPVGLSTDMWTVGVISYVLLSGLSPFLGDTDEDTLANVSVGDWDFDDPSWDDVSDEGKDFICRLMVKDKRRRMTVEEALHHPWMTGPLLNAFNDLSEYIKKMQQSPSDRGPLPPRQKKNFMSLKRWSDDLLPIGRLAERGAIFRRLTMDGVFERNISFETECAPSVKKQLEDIVAHIGDLIATLSCDIGGNPEPHITWFKDSKELVIPSFKYESRYSDGLAELTVKNIEESDAGQYSCRATNDLGSITTRASMRVASRETELLLQDLERESTIKITTTEEAATGSDPPLFHHTLLDCSAKLCEQKILCVTNTTLPEPEVEWYHNGELINRNNYNYLQKHDKGRFELTILKVDRHDEGEWRVIGKNAYGQCECTCHLTVEIPDGYFPPSFDRPLTDFRCEEGEMITLTVRISANPAPLITWYLDDIEIFHSKRRRLQFDVERGEYSLTIVDTSLRDAGEYRCVAKNMVGEAESVCFANITTRKFGKQKKADRLKAPRFQMPLANPRQIPEGAELVLTCVVTGIPEPSITWYKDGERLFGVDIRYENGLCTLKIPNISTAMAGCYTCEAENVHGMGRSSSIVEVTPSPVKNYSVPKFFETLSNRSIFENEEITLECSVTGKPTPTITWYKDGLKLMLESRMLQYTGRKGYTRLNIMRAKIRDSGDYTCEATNILGKDFTHCKVQVNGLPLIRTTPSTSTNPSRCASPSPPFALNEPHPPVITRPITGATVNIGCRELLELEVNGNPTPTVEWYHDGKLVAPSRTLRTYFDGRVAFLKIYRAQMEHAGLYVCKVSNRLGAVESSALLRVEDAFSAHVSNMPQFIRKLEDITVAKSGQSASLSCWVSGEPQPSVCWLHNGRAIRNDSTFHIHESSVGHASLNIAAVTEHCCGIYTAIASNAFGDAHSSATVSMTKEPEPPVSIIIDPCQADGADEISGVSL